MAGGGAADARSRAARRRRSIGIRLAGRGHRQVAIGCDEDRAMRLESAIVIHRRADEVWKFLTEPANLPKWDHGVASVEFRDPTAPEGVGYEFTTVGHRGPDLGRMTYRVSEVDAEARDCRLELTSRTGNA